MRKILRSHIVTRVAGWANKQPFIWDGVYERFDEVPVLGQGFRSEEWLSDMERYTRSAVAAIGNGGPTIPESVPQYHALLASLVAASDRPVRVLDVGGGMGIGFANVRRCNSSGLGFEYVVVDNDESCARGRELFEGVEGITFLPEVPEVSGELGSVDVIVLSGVLQFVEDYEALLGKLAKFRAAYWFFGFLPAGDIPTFVTAQRNVPGSVLPAWFFNIGELVKHIESLGYRLVFKSALDRVFDMSNFPPTHQLHRQCNLLFRCA